MSQNVVEPDEDVSHPVKRKGLNDAVLRTPLKDLPIKPALCFPPDALLQDVIVAMREKHKEAVLICDAKDGKIVGIFTERDLLLRVAGRGWNFHQHRIREVMTPNPQHMVLTDAVGRALNKMITEGYRHIAVQAQPGTENAKEPKLLSVRDVLVYLAEFFPEDVLNLPPGDGSASEREGG